MPTPILTPGAALPRRRRRICWRWRFRPSGWRRFRPTGGRALRGVLAQDPRPRYQEDPQRVYGFGFAGLEVRFRVEDGRAIVEEILPGAAT